MSVQAKSLVKAGQKQGNKMTSYFKKPDQSEVIELDKEEEPIVFSKVQ